MSMLTYTRMNRLPGFGIRHHLSVDMPVRRTAIQAGDEVKPLADKNKCRIDA